MNEWSCTTLHRTPHRCVQHANNYGTRGSLLTLHRLGWQNIRSKTSNTRKAPHTGVILLDRISVFRVYCFGGHLAHLNTHLSEKDTQGVYGQL
jgi:hypothetical protein